MKQNESTVTGHGNKSVQTAVPQSEHGSVSHNPDGMLGHKRPFCTAGRVLKQTAAGIKKTKHKTFKNILKDDTTQQFAVQKRKSTNKRILKMTFASWIVSQLAGSH